MPHWFVSAAQATMKLSAAAIKTFMEEHKGTYPCNDIPTTRQGHQPKWLVSMSRNKEGQVLRQLGHCVIRASCLNHENMQKPIMDGDGVPLPADFAEVLDSLETWGVTKHSCWLQKSLMVMHECLKEDNMCGGVAPKKMRLFHDSVLQGIQRKAEMEFGRKSADCDKILENWNTCFWVRCREEHSFFCVACDSMHCAEEMIESIHAANNANIYSTATIAHNTTANVVPESPLSTVASSQSFAGESTHE